MKRGPMLIVVALAALYTIFFGRKTVEVIVTKTRMIGGRWDKMLPEMREKVTAMLDAAKEAGLDVMFWEGYRTVEEEERDIAKGTSHLKDPYNGHHLWGAAADVVFVNAAGAPSWPDVSDPRWSQLAAIGKAAGLNNPIVWDKPHYELPSFDIRTVRAAYGNDTAQYLADNGVEV